MKPTDKNLFSEGDLALLQDAYTVEAVQPVDLFPHTHHVENVVQLRAKA